MKICRKSRCVLFEKIFPPKIIETQFGTDKFQNLIFPSDFHIHFEEQDINDFLELENYCQVTAVGD